MHCLANRLAAVAVVIGFASSVHAQDDARAILEKAVKAHGGRERFLKFQAMQAKTKGTIEIMGMSIPLTGTMSAQYSGKIKDAMQLEINGMKIDVLTVYNGKEAWVVANGQTVEVPQILEELQEAVYGMNVARFAWLGDKAYQLAPLGETKVNDRPAVGVKISSKGHRDLNFYFDKETGLMAKLEHRVKDTMNGQEVDEERIVNQYQDTEGIKTPKKLTIHRDGKKFMEMEVLETKFLDKPLDDSEFAKP